MPQQLVMQSIEEDTPSTATTPLSPADEQLEPHRYTERWLVNSRKEIAHTSEEWEGMRNLIRQLYIEENKTLSEMSRILKAQHNFIATPKQYKNRFKQWGFWKNLSTQSANNLIQMKESRESLGKPSTFIRSGHKLALNRIEKTIRRSKNKYLSEGSPEKQGHDAASGHSRKSVPASSLPIGIECRTPSPDPMANESVELAAAKSLDFGSNELWAQSDGFQISNLLDDPSDVFALNSVSSPADNLFCPQFLHAGLSSIVSDQLTNTSVSAHYRDAHIDRLERCYNISQKKLALAYGQGLLPSPLTDMGLRTFKSRNALLSALEPVVGDRYRMAELFLCNFAVTFGHHSHFSSFTQRHVLPTIQHGETVRPSIESSIDAVFSSLDLSSSIRSMIEDAGTRDAREDTAPNEFGWHDSNLEDYIDPSALSPSTEISASEFDTPLTPLEGAPCWHNSPESRLISGLEGAAVAYHSGDNASASTQLRSITAYENVTTPKGKVLTRLAWYCLSYISGHLGMAEAAKSCLIQAVQGSTYFRQDEGDEWQDVSHLFR